MKPKDTFFSRKLSINCRGEIYDLSSPRIMGILNITPDSFYDGGRYSSEKQFIGQTEKMLMEGADIIDVGAYSSRPGAGHISEEEEMKRLLPVLKKLKKKFPEALISVDTFRSGVARRAVQEYQVDIVNDISAGEMDKDMFAVIAELGVPYIIMHMQGSPRDMQQNPLYKNLVKEIITFFAGKVDKLKLAGIKDVIIDPGFGFGKTLDHNYELMNHLDTFKFFQLPVLVGISRKSMVYKLLGTTPGESLNGTTVLNTLALLNGANILRVHDVKQAAEAIKIVEKYKEAK